MHRRRNTVAVLSRNAMDVFSLAVANRSNWGVDARRLSLAFGVAGQTKPDQESNEERGAKASPSDGVVVLDCCLRAVECVDCRVVVYGSLRSTHSALNDLCTLGVYLESSFADPFILLDVAESECRRFSG